VAQDLLEAEEVAAVDEVARDDVSGHPIQWHCGDLPPAFEAAKRSAAMHRARAI
jgi:hypothetical protein